MDGRKRIERITDISVNGGHECGHEWRAGLVWTNERALVKRLQQPVMR